MKTTMVIITHNPGIALIGDRIIRMNSGKVVDFSKNENKCHQMRYLGVYRCLRY